MADVDIFDPEIETWTVRRGQFLGLKASFGISLVPSRLFTRTKNLYQGPTYDISADQGQCLLVCLP